MAEVELPEIEIDDENDPFKRRIAMLVVAITLFGTIVAVLENRAGNKEEVAARDAQRLAVSGLGTRVTTDARFHFEESVYTESKVVQREAVNSQRNPRTPDAQRKADAARLADVRAELAPLSPLLNDKAYNDDSSASFDQRLSADENTAPDTARLKQTALVTVQNAYGNKAGGYVAVITVLAVALFLAGLSLTVGGTFRLLLVVPSLIIAVWCVVWTASIARRPVHSTSDAAVKLVVEGNRLRDRAFAQPSDAEIKAGLKEAVKVYDRAVAAGPFFGPAYYQRSQARFAAESPEDLSAGFLSVTSPAALKAVIDDEETALRFDNGNDIEIIDTLGFDYLLDDRPDRSIAFSNEVINRNDKIPRVWFNLGVAQVEAGDDKAAGDAYDRALALIAQDPDANDRSLIYAGARSDLEQVARIRPERQRLVEKYQDRIAAGQLKVDVKNAPATPPGDARIVGNIDVKPEGERVRAEFDYENIPKNSGVAFIWYYRATAKDGWIAQSDVNGGGMSRLVSFQGDGNGKYFVETAPQRCPRPGDYRLDVYVAGKRLASQTTTVAPGDLGTPHEEASDLIGAHMCRPTDWKLDNSDPQVFAMTSPDASAKFVVGTFVLESGDVPDNADPKVMEDAIIQNLFPAIQDSDLEDFTMSDAECRNGVFEANGVTTNATVYLGPDNTVRFAISSVQHDEDFKPVNAMLDTLHFDDLPAKDPNFHPPAEDGEVTG